MSALKTIRWQKFEKVLFHLGCEFRHQNGSHRSYSAPDIVRPIVIAAHSKPLPVFVIKNNLRLLGISNKEYKEILRKIK
jgi:predicted RNA binding protein YcfA (HicA-like mRNA interferase family)